MVAGGDALARDADGRVVFVAGALPGERVVVEVTEERKDYRKARTVEVLDAAPERVDPPCPNVAAGCGGCAWQHIAPPAQLTLKEQIVRDALTRIGRLPPEAHPPIESVRLAGAARTTLRVAVAGGQAHFHQAGSSSALVPATGCLVASPLLVELLDRGRFGDATSATLRAGAATGDRAVLLEPTASGASLPDDVTLVAGRPRRRGERRGVVREVIRGRPLEVSIDAFFQASREAAEALVAIVLASLAPVAGAGEIDHVADLYAGGGLFASAIAYELGVSVVAVERHPVAVADARVNLRDLPATVVAAEVARWRPERRFDAVVADPARPGLGGPGVGAVLAARPRQVVLVSCDVASFARDVRLLREAGWVPATVHVVDAFPHTAHAEVVSLFRPV